MIDKPVTASQGHSDADPLDEIRQVLATGRRRRTRQRRQRRLALLACLAAAAAAAYWARDWIVVDIPF